MQTAIGKHAEFEFDAAADIQPVQSLSYGRCDGAHPRELKYESGGRSHYSIELVEKLQGNAAHQTIAVIDPGMDEGPNE